MLHLLEQVAVLRLLDGVELGADDLNILAGEGAGLDEGDGEVVGSPKVGRRASGRTLRAPARRGWGPWG